MPGHSRGQVLTYLPKTPSVRAAPLATACMCSPRRVVFPTGTDLPSQDPVRPPRLVSDRSQRTSLDAPPLYTAPCHLPRSTRSHCRRSRRRRRRRHGARHGAFGSLSSSGDGRHYLIWGVLWYVAGATPQHPCRGALPHSGTRAFQRPRSCTDSPMTSDGL